MNSATHGRERAVTIGIAALCIVAAFLTGRSCGAGAPPGPGSASTARAGDPAGALEPTGGTARTQPGKSPPAAPTDPMAAGVDALYTRRDPATAAARFREVLAQNPDHYGATFQLATALDQAGDLRASRPVWEKMLKMAEATEDAKTAEAARARLIELDKLMPSAPSVSADPEDATMRLGMEALYTKHDAQGAAVLFRKVLANNAAHYGAIYQLATALDQLGKPAEARPYWEKMLKAAEAIQDTRTADTARARLAKKP